MDIHGNQLLGLLRLAGNNRAEEIDHLLGVVPLGEEEIQTVLGFLDVHGILVGAVLQDQLLQVQESTLVGDLLANLNRGSPCVVGV